MKNKDKQIVPKLRFKEFEDFNGISFKYGDILFDTISDKNHNSDLPILAITQDQGAIPRDKIDYSVSVTEKSVASYKVVDIGDFIISLRSFQGGIEYSLYKGICSPAYIILRKKLDLINKYYTYYFKTNKFIQDMNKDLEGIRDGKMVSYTQFSKLLLPYPKSEEQQKITDCLTSLDNLISAENKKLEQLQKHKKGLMQKLFPAEGKTMPDRRFPEFRDSGEWDQKQLFNVGTYIRGFSYKATDTTSDNKKLLIIRSSNIIPMGKTSYKQDLQFVNKICKAEQLLVENDITICMANGSRNLVGKSSYYDGNYKGEITVGTFCGIYRSSLPVIRWLFQSDLYRKSIDNILQGGNGAIANLKKDDIENLQFYIPKDKKEQKKIADCLSSVDELISEQTNKIVQLKEHKKGLMQGLFPSLEEVQ